MLNALSIHDVPARDLRQAAAILGHERRAFARVTTSELRWPQQSRLRHGPRVRLIDLSAGGALVETNVPLRPDSALLLELVAGGGNMSIESLVTRCYVAALKDGPLYRGGFAFAQPLDIAQLRVPAVPAGRADFIRTDVGLKVVIEPYLEHTPATPGAETPEAVALVQALTVLQATAARRSDPTDRHLASLLAYLLPALQQGEPAAAIVAHVIEQLRRAMPLHTMQIVAETAPVEGFESMYFALLADSVLPPRALQLRFPSGFTLDPLQFRIAKASSYVMSMLRRWFMQPQSPLVDPRPAEAGTVEPSEALASESAPPGAPAAPVDTARAAERPAATPTRAAGFAPWLRVVVRFCDGKLLKGYSNDFLPTRGHLHLSPTATAAESDRLVIPLADLKAVFFVRDLDGFGIRSVADTPEPPPRGRKIEVTFRDGEILVGFTLNFAAARDHGFFVAPDSAHSNNVRVFVVSAAVRHTRFL